MPSFTFRLNGREYRTERQELEVYNLAPDFRDVQRSILPMIVYTDEDTRTTQRLRLGSAFLLEEDVMVTSYHAIARAREVEFRLPNGKSVSTKKGWVIDPKRDIALLHVNPKGLRKAGVRPLELERSGIPTYEEIGRNKKVVFTSGWPAGRQEATSGVWYSGIRLDPEQHQWVSSNAVHPGDSGGPLLDESGRVLGVISMGNDTGDRNPLSGNICIANDPRPALQRKWFMERPVSFNRLREDAAVLGQPFREVFEAMDVLSQVARRNEALPAAHVLAQFDNLSNAIDRNPSDPGLHYLRGSLHQLMGDDAAASEDFSGALHADQGHFLSAVALGRNSLLSHRFSDAIEAFASIRNIPPYRRVAQRGLIRAYMGQKKYERAYEILRSVLAEDAFDVWAVYWLGQYFIATDQDVKAWQIVLKLGGWSQRWSDSLRRHLAHPDAPAMEPIHFIPLR